MAKQAIDLILCSIDGYVDWSNNSTIRTFCHGFLFHYEYLVKQGKHCISGDLDCKHQDECPYRFAYHLLCALNNEQPLANGCSFAHSNGPMTETEVKDISSVLQSLVGKPFLDKLELIYSVQSKKQRDICTRHFALTSDKDVWGEYPLFDDTIFTKAKLVAEKDFPSLSTATSNPTNALQLAVMKELEDL